jgi:beta-galactosidase
MTRASRRDFIRYGAASAAALAADSILWSQSPAEGAAGPASRTISLDPGWLFGGRLIEGALRPEFDDSKYARISLPHCVAKLSWQKWDPAAWQDVWAYRGHFSLPPSTNTRRVFVHFDAVMVGARPVINGHELPEHLGGYLPFEYEITRWLQERDNVLAAAVDSRWKNVPPEGSPAGPSSIDYLEPGGIVRGVQLRTVPPVFISDVFAKPVQVMDARRAVEVTGTVDAAVAPDGALELRAQLLDGGRPLASASRSIRIQQPGETAVSLTLSKLGNIELWDVETPRLYDVVVTLLAGGKAVHDYRTRIGFRDARFETDGFFLNGARVRLFGLNRHELYPYVGGAMPRRVLRRDAEMLRRDFNCNFVRCSHYPQSPAFLDACDELGLMVWEEIPGWQYVGDEEWQEFAVRDVREMVRRDRNHPAIVIWGVRINESPNKPELYRRTKQAAKALDDSRPTSGTMTQHSKENWLQDVFAFDDYHASADGSVGIRPPLPGAPYMVAEAVGQFEYGAGKGFRRRYRRAGPPDIQSDQALLHAQAHNRAASHPRCAGVVAWCAFDYGSLINSYEGVKCPGVADVFRIPKLGASFYLAQVDPKKRAVIEPDFFWDFGPQTPAGPGARAAIFSNCDSLKVLIDGRPVATLSPDRANYPNIKYPPFFADLRANASAKPELRIEGYLGGRLVASRSFASDTGKDRLLLRLDDARLTADASDATRLAFGIADQFGNWRAYGKGTVAFEIDGPGEIVGDNPFSLDESGGVGAIWVRAGDKPGRITVAARCPPFARETVRIEVAAPSGRSRTPGRSRLRTGEALVLSPVWSGE